MSKQIPTHAHCKHSRPLPYFTPNKLDAPVLEAYPAPSHHPTTPMVYGTLELLFMFYAAFEVSIQLHVLFNPTALRKAKIVYNFGLSECNRVKILCFLRVALVVFL